MERTHDPDDDSTTPSGNSIMDEHATVEKCTEDYQDGADVRGIADKKWTSGR